MRTLEEIRGLYDNVLRADLLALESQRKEALKKIYISGALIVPLSVFLSILISHPFFLILGLLGMAALATFFAREYTKNFKVGVIEKLVKFLDARLDYSKNGFISQSFFEQSRLFLHRIDEYSGDDHVRGMLDKTKVDFSEIHAKYVVHTKNGRQEHTIFKGLFFIADFNKHFNGRTVILPDFAEKHFGVLGSFFQEKNMARDALVKLEDPEFEKLFAVYGTDQIEARYILSTGLMRRITAYKKKVKRNIHLSFVDDKVFIAIPYVKNLFEPRLFRTIVDFAPIQEYYEDLTTAISIVEELNLNTRIWTKK